MLGNDVLKREKAEKASKTKRIKTDSSNSEYNLP